VAVAGLAPDERLFLRHLVPLGLSYRFQQGSIRRNTASSISSSRA
jgi:hypothetical protein